MTAHIDTDSPHSPHTLGCSRESLSKLLIPVNRNGYNRKSPFDRTKVSKRVAIVQTQIGVPGGLLSASEPCEETAGKRGSAE